METVMEPMEIKLLLVLVQILKYFIVAQKTELQVLLE